MADHDSVLKGTHDLILVTIVAEAILEQRIARELRALKVSGFTVTSAQHARNSYFQGSRGSRAGDIEGGNVRIETIVPPELATRVLQHIEAAYFEHYAVIAWVAEVGVLRGEKYL